MAWGAFGIHGHGAAPVNSPYRSSSITKPIPRGEMRTHSVPARISGPSFKQQYMNAFVTRESRVVGGANPQSRTGYMVVECSKITSRPKKAS